MTVHQAIDRLKAAGIDIRTATDSEMVKELTELATELLWPNPAERAAKMVAYIHWLDRRFTHSRAYIVELEVETFIRVRVDAVTPEEAMDLAQELVTVEGRHESLCVDVGFTADLVEVYAGNCSAERWEVDDA